MKRTKKYLLCVVDAVASVGAAAVEVETVRIKMTAVGLPYLVARSTIDIVDVGIKQIKHPKNFKQNKRELANDLRRNIGKAFKEVTEWHF